MKKLKPDSLRNTSPQPHNLKKIKRHDIYLILDNIMDTYNVGTIFRLADATSVKKLYLCGITEKPPNTKVKKASINTWQWVDWEYHVNTLKVIDNLKKKIPKIRIVAIEQNNLSLPYQKGNYKFPVALVVGHETKGVSQEVLDVCDEIVELPMYGVNVSLNVIVALSIVTYKTLEKNNL